MASTKRSRTDYMGVFEDYMNMPTEMILISDIVYQGRFNPRHALAYDDSNIARLRSAVLSGTTLPPVGVIRLSDGKFKYLWGRHRVHNFEELSKNDQKFEKIAVVVLDEDELTLVDEIGLGSVENELEFDQIDGKWVARESHGPMAHKIEDYVKQVVELKNLGISSPKDVVLVLPLAPPIMLKDAIHLADSQIRNIQQALAIRDVTRWNKSEGEEGMSMKTAWKAYFQKGGSNNPSGITRTYPAFEKLIFRHAEPGNGDLGPTGEEFIMSISGNFATSMKNISQTINRKLGTEVLEHYESGALSIDDVDSIFDIFASKLKSALRSVEKRHKEFTERQVTPVSEL